MTDWSWRIEDERRDQETQWQDAYAEWWRSVKAGDWGREQELRNTMDTAWRRLPQETKVGAWDRYVHRYGWRGVERQIPYHAPDERSA